MMTSRLFRFSTGVGILIILVAATLFWAQGSAAAGKDRCDLRSLKGTYVFAARGVTVDGDAVLPWAEAGTWTLDGAGRAEGFWSGSINGVTIASQKPFNGTYRHTTGCVYSAVDSENLTWDLYLTDQGDTITYFTAGISGTMHRK